MLEGARKKTKPRKLDLYDVCCGVLYVTRTGCQWRMLPKDYPKWASVYAYFRIWENADKSEKVFLKLRLKKLVGKERLKNGRNEETTFCIIDTQSVKNTDTAEQKGYDAGKKVSGIKRHIAVDMLGLPHAICITTANVTDRDDAVTMFNGKKGKLCNVINVLADGGYSSEKFACKIKELIGSTVEVVKRNELHKFEVLPKRWIVERCFAWLEKCRRLLKNCERKIETSMQMVNVAFTALLLKRL
jgi:transposase